MRLLSHTLRPIPGTRQPQRLLIFGSAARVPVRHDTPLAGRFRHVPGSPRSRLALVWAGIERSQVSATPAHVFERARVSVPDAVLASYFKAWEPHTITHSDAPVLLRELRRRNIRIGVLSNTLWPRAVHDQFFARDQVLDLIDGTVYSCELPWTKPHPEAFRAAMTAVGEDDPALCVFVGDRPFDDVHGAKGIGMRAVLMQGSNMPPFEAAVPDATITRLSQLLPHLDRW